MVMGRKWIAQIQQLLVPGACLECGAGGGHREAPQLGVSGYVCDYHQKNEAEVAFVEAAGRICDPRCWDCNSFIYDRDLTEWGLWGALKRGRRGSTLGARSPGPYK